MKAVILAGGMGTRLSEETTVRPKPMVEIGGKPILWHIMKIYSAFGVDDFVICCGYMGYVIKEYFANYFLHSSDVTFDIKTNDMTVHESASEPWTVTLVDTGEHTGTGGRLRRVRKYLGDEDFYFTYGDGVADVDIAALTAFHRESGKLATLTAIQPPSKYGVLAFEEDAVSGFDEKPHGKGGWINGGFFVLNPRVIDYIDGDDQHWEHEPMKRLVDERQLAVYRHGGFWQCMDTLRDKNYLESVWDTEKPPWRVWT